MSSVVPPAAWSGARRVPVSNAVLGTGVYVATAIMFFGGLVSAYLVLRAGSPAWPPAGQPRLPVAITGANTLVLLASGLCVWWARRAAQLQSRTRALHAAIVLGFVFVGVQGIEWIRLVGYGLRASGGSYGATFYTIVGAHAVHALGGIAMLVVTSRFVRAGRGDLPAALLYWGFVVLLWPVLYALVYLV
ncbi:MAG: heme-copper oxidase subunit III [Candidatus Latescibacterota bacterium]|nr:MAG: heme-copper oxidase subunit III [Candidatus Latescibacterota bacterium]